MAQKNIPPQAIGGIYNLPVPPDRKATDFLNSYNGWIYSAVSLIAKAVSNINLHLYKKKVGRNGKLEVVEIYEHEALNLLYSVNDFQTKETFLEITQTYLDITGEAVWALLRDSKGKPVEIWPLRPDWVSVIPSKEEYIGGYEYRPMGLNIASQSVKFERNDIVFFKYPNPVNPYRGKGAVQAGAMQIDIDMFSDDWNRTFFYNSALPYIFFTSDKAISPESIDRFMEKWRSKFEGRFNSHKVAFLGGGFKPDVVGGNLKDLDFLEGKKYIRDELLSLFHISKANIGIVEDVNRANQEATDVRFSKMAVKPRMISLISHLNEFYLRNWADEDLFFDYDDPTPEDVDLKLRVYDNGLKNGWMTINEVRDNENLPPVENGDVIYLPFGLQPVGTIPNKSLINTIFNKGDNNNDRITLKLKKKRNSERKINIKVPPRKLWKLRQDNLKKDIKDNVFKLIYSLVKIKDMQNKKENREELKEVFWKNMIAKTDVKEESMKAILDNLITEQAKTVTNNIRDNYRKGLLKMARGKALSEFLFDKEEEIRKWLSALQPFIKNVVEDKGREILDFLGVGGNIQTHTNTAVAYLQREGVRFIAEVNGTTGQLLKDVLSEGLAEGESIAELQSRVSNVYEQARGDRAKMIARTEVLRATNFATEEAYRQSKVVKGKEWLTALDERTCKLCNELDGKVIPVNSSYFKEGETYTVGDESITLNYDTVKHPPLHPNCRCTLIPVLE